MTDGPGLATNPPMPEGVKEYEKLRQAGFSEPELHDWVATTTGKLRAAGFKPSEIEAHWGAGDPDDPRLAAWLFGNVQEAGMHVAKNPGDAFLAGWQMSDVGLISRADKPDMTLDPGGILRRGKAAGLDQQLPAMAGQLLGDLPASIAGFFVGAPAGGRVAALAGPEAVPYGVVVGGGVGAAATPEAVRQVLLDAYGANGTVKTWQDAARIAIHSLAQVGKAGVVGGLSAGAGELTGSVATKVGAGPVVAGGANTAAMVTTGAVTAAAMDGHMPNKEDFILGAANVLAFHAGAKVYGKVAQSRVQANLETIYRQTGLHPNDVVELAKTDPEIQAELFSQDVHGNPVTPALRLQAPDEPPPPKYADATEARGPTQPATQLPSGKYLIDNSKTYTSELRNGEFYTQLTVDGVEKWVPDSQIEFPPSEPKAKGAPSANDDQPKSLIEDMMERPGSVQHRVSAEIVPFKKPVIATSPQEAEGLLLKLEGSADDATSPAGAIGRYQIMPGTARQYMGKDFDVHTLYDPKVNEFVGRKIIADLHRRYNGDMTAIAIAYNAGPGRAGEYLTKGPGTRLKAIPDKKSRDMVRYEAEPSARDESFLPLETQKYLANGRRRSGGEMPGGSHDDNGPWPRYADQELAAGGGGSGEPPGGGGPPASGDTGGEGFWQKASLDTLTGEMLSNIGEEARPASLLNVDRVMGQYVSELTPARNIDARLLKAGAIDEKSLNTEDMFRQTYGSDMRAGVFVRYGAIDPITLDIVKGSPSVLDAVRATKEDGGNFDGWVAYMLAKRTTDKAEQGINTGFNPKAAAALASNKKAIKQYQRATDLFNSVMDSGLDYAKGSGMYSQGQVDAMKASNPTYLSFRRIMGDDASFSAGGRGFGPRNTLRKMEGSDRQIVDPIAATIDNLRLIIKMADRNRAIGHIVGYAERGQFSGLVRVPWDPKATIAEAGSDVFKPYGMEPVAASEAYGPMLAQRVQKSLGDNEFIYFRDGMAEKWKAESPELANLIRKADSPGEANIIMETAGFFAKLQRTGIVTAPGFMGRAIFKDQLQAFLLDKTHPVPFLTWIEGAIHVAKGDAIYQDLLAKGGMGSALADMDADWLGRDMHRLLSETGAMEGVSNLVKHPLELAQLINEKLDAANRVGYSLQAQRKGYDPIKAATMSRKAYLDFAERATSNFANGMAKTVPFFRPTLLGVKQFGEAVTERPVSTLTYATVALGVPVLLNFIANWYADQDLPDGEKWTDQPQWQRDTHLITPPIAGARIKMPMPYETGIVFNGVLNRVLDRMANDNPRAFKGMAQSVIGAYLPSVIPAIAAPAAEVVTNHNFFTNKPLIPSSLEAASGYMQYTPATSETGKKIARILGPAGLDVVDFSPIQFDEFVKGWTGTAGQSLLKVLDVPDHAAKKPYELADLPFVGSFVARNPGTSAQPVTDFYDEMKKLETHHADYALALKRLEGGDVDNQDVAITASASQYATAVQPIKDAMSIMSTVIQGIQQNKEMTDVEKRQSIDDILPSFVGAAKAGLKIMDGLPKRDLTPPDQGPGAPPPSGFEQAPQKTPASVPTPAPNQGLVPIA